MDRQRFGDDQPKLAPRTGVTRHLDAWLGREMQPERGQKGCVISCFMFASELRNHTLVIIRPHNVSKDLCLLYFAMGFYSSPLVPSWAVESSDEDVQAAAQIALATGHPTAVLFNVPAEFLTPQGAPHPLQEESPSSLAVCGSANRSTILIQNELLVLVWLVSLGHWLN